MPTEPILTLSRRGFLITGAAAITLARRLPADPACTLISEQEEGPYYIADELVRPNITEGKPGVPLKLRVAVVDAKRCAPLGNAALDIWHCDAVGAYSGFAAMGPGGPGGFGPGGPGGPGGFGPGGPPPGPPPDGFGPGGPGGPGGHAPVVNKDRFLRGVQLTNAQGIAEFMTIYPGWYQGRTIHIHVKVHLGGETAKAKYQGGHVSHTGQFFFPEDLTADIAKLQPYVKHANVRRTLQAEDFVFTDQHGSAGMLRMERLTPGSNAAGFVANITIAVDPDATPAPTGFGGPRGPRSSRG
jgi:protocatechuate 3,4-dioxygenase beta subunit